MSELRVLKVYRYTNSNKLVAATGRGNSVLCLNTDLSFSNKEGYRVRRSTSISLTTYRIEVEVKSEGNQEIYHIIRTWDEKSLPAKSTDPNAMLEERINISPSHLFSEDENKYIGKNGGHASGYLLCVVAVILLVIVIGAKAFSQYWLLPVIVFITGVCIIKKPTYLGDPEKIEEIRSAKERVRKAAEIDLQKVMQNVHLWSSLDGIQFEAAVGMFFEQQGYEIEFTPRTNDGGVDLILRKNGIVKIVQCKNYEINVGVSTVREMAGARASWPGADAVVVAMFDFTKAAKYFARENNIELISIGKDHMKTYFRPGR